LMQPILKAMNFFYYYFLKILDATLEPPNAAQAKPTRTSGAS